MQPAKPGASARLLTFSDDLKGPYLSWWFSPWPPCIRRATASSPCSAFLFTTIAKRDVDLIAAAIGPGGTTVIAVRNCHAALELPECTVHAYFSGLTGTRPCQRERYRLGLDGKQEWLLAGA